MIMKYNHKSVTVVCFPSSAVVFGGIVMAGAFAVQYTGIMVLQVTNCELLNRPYKVE